MRRAQLWTRNMRPLCVALVGLLTLPLVAGPATAQEPDPIFTAARSAVAANRIEKSKALGGYDPKRAFTELPERGAVLVGFDCGIGKFANIETVYALRPLYRTAEGEESYQEYGLFADRRLPRNQVQKSKVVRKVRIEARPGYAVGGVTLRTGLNINGLCVTFMKINGRALDPNHSYTSEWVGDRTGGHEASVGGDGAAVVGVYGSQDEEHVYGLGLLYVNEPPPAPPRVDKPADPPQSAKPDVPPAKPAKLTRTEKPAVLPVERPAAPASLPDPPLADVMDDEVVTRPVAPVTQPSVKAVIDAEAWTVWLPVGVFGVVVLLVFAVSLVFYGVNRRPPVPDRKTRRRIPTLEPADDDALTRKAPRLPADPERFDAETAGVPLADPREQTGFRADLPVPQPAAGRGALVPRGGNFACSSCRRTVVADAAQQPWCPHCGADLAGEPEGKQSVVPDAPAKRAGSPGRAFDVPERARGESRFVQPPSFHGRTDRTYRIFVLQDELLFLDAPAREDRSPGENMARGLAPMGGLIGAMIGGTIADALAEGRMKEVRRRQDQLDRADTEELQERADHERNSFRAEVAGLAEVSIVALSFWERLFSENCAGRLHLYHRDRGRMTVVLPTPADMRAAIKHLSVVLGDDLTVNAVWDYGKNRYVLKS